MRKWMAERLKRRKKPAEPASSETKPTPLQPAYFDAEPASAPPAEVDAPAAPEVRETSQPGPEAAEPTSGGSAGEARRDSGPARTRRRRRGGRGRGRSQAAAEQPAAVQPVAEVVPQLPPTPKTPKGTVVLAIGLPGSGKSSWFKRNNITALSTDMLRSLLFDDATEQRFQDLVFSNLRSMLKARLIARRPLNYVDATNLTPHERHGWIKLARDFGYEVQAVYFDVPFEVCLERNRRRDRVVDEAVLRRMADKLKAPTFEEGFTKITVVRVKKKDNQAAESLSPE